MRVLATYNIKGGVGKTASVINLAYLAARGGASTLVWDLDPQGAASYYFRIKSKIKGGGKRLIRGKTALEDFIHGTDFEGLDLIPADFSYRNMDLFLEMTSKAGHQLRNLLKPFRNEYDYVFLDCPPGISLTSENVFAAADAILLPTIPTTLSLRTYHQVARFFRQEQLDIGKLLPFFTMVDRRKQLHRSIADNPPDSITGLLATRIPFSSVVERMGDERAPIGVFAPTSRPARCYQALWEDIESSFAKGRRQN